MTHTLSRRGLLSAAGALGLAALTTACGTTDKPGSASSSDGSWEFTDDRGTKATTTGRPQRIVAYTGTAAALYDFGLGDRIVGVFGPTKLADGKPDPMAGDLPIDKVEILGNVWGEFNVEKYAGLRPELLVTDMYVAGDLWYVPAESKDKIVPLAPSVAITTGGVPMIKPIERHAELAKSLGADLSAPKVADAKARFEAAAKKLSEAGKSTGLKVLACSAAADLFYASNPAKNTDLIYYKELGVDVIVPDKIDQQGYFESLSWENADKYAADVLLLDDRSVALQPKDLTGKPVWNRMPAVKAGQIVGWSSEPRYSYAGAAPLLEKLANALTTAKKLT
jgi:iron complex transport system substrate-binding protein